VRGHCVSAVTCRAHGVRRSSEVGGSPGHRLGASRSGPGAPGRRFASLTAARGAALGLRAGGGLLLRCRQWWPSSDSCHHGLTDIVNALCRCQRARRGPAASAGLTLLTCDAWRRPRVGGYRVLCGGQHVRRGPAASAGLAPHTSDATQRHWVGCHHARCGCQRVRRGSAASADPTPLTGEARRVLVAEGQRPQQALQHSRAMRRGAPCRFSLNPVLRSELTKRASSVSRPGPAYERCDTAPTCWPSPRAVQMPARTKKCRPSRRSGISGVHCRAVSSCLRSWSAARPSTCAKGAAAPADLASPPYVGSSCARGSAGGPLWGSRRRAR